MQVTAITAGPDGAVWFADGLNKIGRITTSASVFDVPTVSLLALSFLGVALATAGYALLARK